MDRSAKEPKNRFFFTPRAKYLFKIINTPRVNTSGKTRLAEVSAMTKNKDENEDKVASRLLSPLAILRHSRFAHVARSNLLSISTLHFISAIYIQGIPASAFVSQFTLPPLSPSLFHPFALSLVSSLAKSRIKLQERGGIGIGIIRAGSIPNGNHRLPP